MLDVMIDEKLDLKARALGDVLTARLTQIKEAYGCIREVRVGLALSLWTTTHPLYTISTNIFGTSCSEARMRPNPRSRPAPY